MAETVASIDDYIASFPGDVQAILQRIRRVIHDAVPGTEETSSYQMPTITLDGRYLIYFAGWKSHISVYPVPEADDALAAELSSYRSAKGTLKFPLAKPIPYELIGRVAAKLAEQRPAR